MESKLELWCGMVIDGCLRMETLGLWRLRVDSS
jgi:hypothetical protein